MLRPAPDKLRTRTLTGCYTCRERKLKCDDRRPECQRCSALGLDCQGYAPKLSWVDSTPDLPRINEASTAKRPTKRARKTPSDPMTRRRPLYTGRLLESE
ncbi:hypothetical protein BJY00DRAFT_292698 [Aspergillus carlsbadensis]|nr:hypothetical protein BJY00DRAFT_292698 [Aspergillus carlsbadensis]